MINQKNNHSEKGQALVIFAIAIMALIAISGLAIDGGLLYSTKRNTQRAADSAALAGALAVVQGKDVNTAVKNISQANGFQPGSVAIHHPPVSGTYKNNTDYVQVVISVNSPTFLIGAVYSGDIPVTSEAIVKIGGSSKQLLAGDGTFIAANPTDCQSFYADGGIMMRLEGGGIFVNSSCPLTVTKKTTTAAFFETGNPSVVVNNGTIQVVGGFYKPQWSGTLSPTPVTGVAQRTYNDILIPNCGLKSNFSADPNYVVNQSGAYGTYGTWTSKPGVYPNGITIGNGAIVNLQPGLYCVDGNVTMAGGTTIKGNNVTIVMRGGNFTISNGANVELTAASSSTTYVATDGSALDVKGLLVVANPSSYSATLKTFAFVGGGVTKYVGTVYAPKTDCTFSDGAVTSLLDIQMVCNHIKALGGTNLTFYNYPDHYYAVGSNQKTLELSQ